MSKQVSVAIIEPVGGHGGMDYYDFGLAGGLVHAGLDVVLHTCDETAIPPDALFEVRHTFKKIYGKDAAWKRGLRFVRDMSVALFSAVIERRQLVHFHYFHIGVLQLAPVLLARLLMRKVVITAHDVESFVQGLEVPILSRWTYRLAHRVVAHNQVSKKELMGKLGLGEQKIVVIPHGNYLHVIRPLPSSIEARQKIGIKESVPVILFFGQIKDVKGLDLLIEAMPEVLKQAPDAVLLIAGKPWKSDFSAYETLIEKLGLQASCIKHIRFIPDDEVSFFYAACDLIVLPYRRIYQSGVILMAMSYRRPVLVSDLPGMTEIVEDGKNGFIFKRDDAVDLAKKINLALSARGNLELIAKQGFVHVKENYSWDVIGESTKGVYENLAG